MTISNYKFIVFLIGELIYYFSLHLFLIGLLKVQTRKHFISVYSFCWITFGIILYFIQVPSYVSVLSSVLICTMLSMRYSHNVRRNIMYSILFSFFGNIMEFIVVYSIMFISSIPLNTLVSNDYSYMVSLLACRFLLLLLSFIIFLSKEKFQISLETTNFWSVIAIFTVGSLYIFYVLAILCLRGTLTNYPIIILILSVLIIFNITVYHLYNCQCKDHRLNEENNRLINYINIQKTQQEETSAYVNKMSGIKHDLQHLFTGLSALMDSGCYGEAADIIHRNAHIFAEPAEIVNTADAAINSFLNYKIPYARNHNIEVTYHSLITSSINMNFDDLCILLGNAFDNATEYLISHDMPKKQIDLKFSYDYGIFSIDISNPVCQNVEVPKDYILPTSKHSANHGYGISSMKKIAEKYDGILSVSCKDNIFAIKVTFICQ